MKLASMVAMAAFFLPQWLVAAGNGLEQARALYGQTRYAEALRLLDPRSGDPAVAALAGRCRYMMDDFKGASELFQLAVRLSPESSEYHNWLGKALGRRAETSSFLTAPRYASQCRQAFEKAVSLDPKNIEAMNDLFEYYLEAPGFLGGGTDKAAALAVKIAALNPAEGHWAQSKLAAKRKDFAAAEAQLRRAAELEPKELGRLIDLARFLGSRGRPEESDEAFARAEAIGSGSPKLLFARAQTWVEGKRNVEQARALLKRLLASPLTPDDPPRGEAEKLLKKTPGG